MSSSNVNPQNFQISMEEINRATQNFSPTNMIRDQWNYKLYHGRLSESWGNRTVVILQRKLKYKETKSELSEVIKIATSFHHENIITFIGYCFEGDELFRVMEYATNGTLYNFLVYKIKRKRCKLTWAQRLKICISAARGLKHLHEGRVIHGNFTCFSVLLDENLEAKITKFGRSVLVSENQPHLQIYNSIRSSHRSITDPIYKETGVLNIESDVYSYGLILFEILSGNSRYMDLRIDGFDAHKLIFFVRQFKDDDLLDKLIDPSLKDQIDNHCFRKFIEIAYKCISLDIKDRPSMDGIIKKLEEALYIHVIRHGEYLYLACPQQFVTILHTFTSQRDLCCLIEQRLIP